MKLFFDLDRGYLVGVLGGADALGGLTFKRGDTVRIDVIFARDVKKQELPGGATGRIGIKRFGDYSGPYLANASAWEQAGSGEDAIYSFEINLNTVELNAALGEDPSGVSAMFEMEFVVGDSVTSSQTVPATITNDVIKGGEAGAIVIAEGEPVNWALGAAAAGSIQIDDVPANNDTVTVGTRTYTWKTAAILPGQITIGATVDDNATALQAAIEGDVLNTEHPDVATTGVLDGTVGLAAKEFGTAGNEIVLEASGFITLSGPTLTGGVETVEPTPGQVGAMRVTLGFLYVVSYRDMMDRPVWQRVALSDL